MEQRLIELDQLRANVRDGKNLTLVAAQLGEDGAIVVAEELQFNTRLLSLEVDVSNLRMEHAALNQSPCGRKHTLTPRLQENLIGDAGAIALSQALQKNATLTVLTMDV